MLADKMVRIYESSSVKKVNKEKSNQRVVAIQYNYVLKRLKQAAKSHQHTVRFEPNSFEEETLQLFRQEGFIVWDNNMTTVITIPVM